jgi:hypothetical protein
VRHERAKLAPRAKKTAGCSFVFRGFACSILAWQKDRAGGDIQHDFLECGLKNGFGVLRGSTSSAVNPAIGRLIKIDR